MAFLAAYLAGKIIIIPKTQSNLGLVDNANILRFTSATCYAVCKLLRNSVKPRLHSRSRHRRTCQSCSEGIRGCLLWNCAQSLFMRAIWAEQRQPSAYERIQSVEMGTEVDTQHQDMVRSFAKTVNRMHVLQSIRLDDMQRDIRERHPSMQTSKHKCVFPVNLTTLNPVISMKCFASWEEARHSDLFGLQEGRQWSFIHFKIEENESQRGTTNKGSIYTDPWGLCSIHCQTSNHVLLCAFECMRTKDQNHHSDSWLFKCWPLPQILFIRCVDCWLEWFLSDRGGRVKGRDLALYEELLWWNWNVHLQIFFSCLDAGAWCSIGLLWT